MNKLFDLLGEGVRFDPVCSAKWFRRLLVSSIPTLNRIGYSLLTVGAGAGAAYVCYNVYMDCTGASASDLYRYVISVILEKTSWSLDYDQFREKFQKEFHPAPLRQNPSHPHPTAALRRKCVDFGIQQFLNRLGYDEYPISTSRRDTQAGQHLWIWGRDLAFRPSYRGLTDKSVIKLIDVDYYLDMPALISRRKPIIMYTFNPLEAGGQTDDGMYWIQNNKVHYRVRGGSTYEHYVWDYGVDVVQARSFCGTTIANVDVKPVGGSGRIVVSITPTRFVLWPFCLFVKAPTIQRHVYTHGVVNVVRRITDTGGVVSLARESSSVSVTIPEDVFLSCAIRYEKSAKPSISDLERMLAASGVEEPHVTSALLFDLLDTKTSILTDLHVMQVPSYMALPEAGQLVTEDVNPRGRITTGPLGDASAVAPSLGLNSERSAVEGRVQKLLNKTVPPQRYYKYAKEFVELLLPKAGIGAPDQAYEVYQSQNGVLQRARNDKEWFWTSARKKLRVNIFVKSEAYSSATDPRIISSVDPNHNMALSCYTYAFKEQVLKLQPWYAPARAPAEIEEHLLNVCYRNAVVELDYSRFDGTISQWLRENVEQATYLRWVSRSYQSELHLLLSKEVRVTASTVSGVRSKTGGQRLSGSPLTTDGNTLINAFVTYAARRNSGVLPCEAFARMGLFAGDDGIALVTLPELEIAAKDIGLKLEARTVVMGRLNFLGRVFNDPCNGDARSIQDPDRTIRKLHFTFSPRHISLEQALINKAYGYLTLDPQAPLVSDWCRKILELHPGEIPCVDARDLPYNARAVFVDGAATWTQLDRGHAVDLCAQCLRCEAGDVVRWTNEIRAARRLTDLVGIVHLPRLSDKKGHYVIQPMLPVQGGVPAVPVEKDSDVSSVCSDPTHNRKRRSRR